VSAVTEPMRGTVDRSMFRRISWAPDGTSLCVSAAAKATKPIGVVLRRGTWESLADLVGHQAQAVPLYTLITCTFKISTLSHPMIIM